MSSFAIRTENLGKMYRLTDNRNVGTLRDLLADRLRKPFRREARQSHSRPFWALRDVSFTLNQGEVLGIIGRNGSGKSTLLKMLARISRPSEGWLEVRGHIRSLLEVGVGFHPELSGRENIYLNGSIMGIKRAEIDRHLDEIIDFSGVAPFIDMPVKFYSSGMYVRLAFSASVHLDPDILLIDEVLAVGDIEFQKKCLIKLDEARQLGKTILIVSHNMAPIVDMSTQVLWLEKGQVAAYGDPRQIVSAYMQEQTSGTLPTIGAEEASEETDPPEAVPLQEVVRQGEVIYDPPQGTDGVKILRAYVTDESGAISSRIPYESSFSITIEYEVEYPARGLRVAFRLYNERNQAVIHTATSDRTSPGGEIVGTPGLHSAKTQIPGAWFVPGPYVAELGIFSPGRGHHFHTMNAFTFHIGGLPLDSIGMEILRPMLDWQVEALTGTN